MRPRTAFQSSFRQAGLAQGIEIPLVSGRPSNRADFSGMAQRQSRHHLDVSSGGLSRLRLSTRQP